MENGFYIWKGNDDDASLHALNMSQVVGVIENEVWLTGMRETFDIEDALKFGEFGECVFKATYK